MKRKRSKPKIDRTMPMVHPNAAAIDVGATMHMAAVRADRTPEPVRSFGTFTTDLRRLVDWLKECDVETVVMESTSVYWIPICRSPILASAIRYIPWSSWPISLRVSNPFRVCARPLWPPSECSVRSA